MLRTWELVQHMGWKTHKHYVCLADYPFLLPPLPQHVNLGTWGITCDTLWAPPPYPFLHHKTYLPITSTSYLNIRHSPPFFSPSTINVLLIIYAQLPNIFRYSYTMRLSLFHEYCKTADGITIFFDISQTRTMFTGAGSHNAETLVRSVTAHGPDGSSFNLTPFINIPSNYTALGVLGGLNLKELRLRQFCRRDGRWRYILLSLCRGITLI